MDHNFLPLDDSEHKRSDCVDWNSADELVKQMFTADGIDDAAWFDAHPGRNFRIRPAGRGELLTFGDPPAGYIPFTVVRQLAPGARIRLYGTAKEEPPTWDFPERVAESLWRSYAATTIPPDTLAHIEGCIARELAREREAKS
jgi:hypothetical protein